MASTMRNITRPARARRAHQMPSGTPMTMAMPTAIATITMCSPVARRTSLVIGTHKSLDQGYPQARKISGGGVSDHAAAVEQHDPLSDAQCLGQIVRDEDDGHTAAQRDERILQIAP